MYVICDMCESDGIQSFTPERDERFGFVLSFVSSLYKVRVMIRVMNAEVQMRDSVVALYLANC